MQLGAGALGPQHAGDGVHEDEGADLGGGVELDRLPGEGVAVPVPGAGAEDVANEAGVGAAGEGDVEEPGSGDDDVADAVGVEEAGAQHLGDGGGGLSGRAGELEGDVGGVVAAATGPGGRDDDPLGHHGHGEFSLVDGTTHRVQHGAGELDGVTGQA